jgi:hypothetical protein
MDCRHRTSIVTNSDRIMSSMLFASQARACLPGPASTPQQGLLPACARPEPGPNPARTRPELGPHRHALRPLPTRGAADCAGSGGSEGRERCGQRRERRARAVRAAAGAKGESGQDAEAASGSAVGGVGGAGRLAGRRPPPSGDRRQAALSSAAKGDWRAGDDHGRHGTMGVVLWLTWFGTCPRPAGRAPHAECHLISN